MKRHPADPLDRWLERVFPLPVAPADVRGWVVEALRTPPDDPDAPAVLARLERLEERWRAGDLAGERGDAMAAAVRAAEPDWGDPEAVITAWLDGHLAPAWAAEVARRAEGEWRERVRAALEQVPGRVDPPTWRPFGRPDPDPAADLALARLAVPERAAEVIDDLRSGPARAAIDAALARLRAGDDSRAEDDEALAANLVGLRRELEEWAGDPEIGPRLAALDEALFDVRALTRLVDFDDHVRLVEGIDPHPGEWWTARLLVDAALEERLVALLAGEREVLAADHHEAVLPPPGTAGSCAVPLARPGGGAVLGTVTIATTPGGLPLGDDAVRAVHVAWRAAARWFPERALQEPLGMVHAQVHAPAGAEVDGASLGLPTALAFLSRWSGRALAVAATGRIDDAPSGPRVGPVGAISAKAAAAAAAGHALLAPLNSGHGAIEVETVQAAWEAAGGALVPPDPTFEPLPALEARIGALVRRVEVADGGWLDLLDRLLIDLELAQQRMPDHRDLPHWRVTAAVAALHAANPGLAQAILEDIDIPADAPAADQALVRAARLAVRIDRDDHAAMLAEPAGLVARFEALRDAEQVRLAGFLLGTAGRALNHGGRPDLAVGPLRRALDLHLARRRHEAPRSGVYLAAALRRGGDPVAALAVLDEVADALQHAVPRDAGAGYHDMTRAYWHYERARAHLDLGDAPTALVEVDRALAMLRGRPPELWPRAGFLRTRAWALHALGRSRARELDEIDSLVEAAGDAPAAVRRIAAEARGPVRHGADGETY